VDREGFWEGGVAAAWWTARNGVGRIASRRESKRVEVRRDAMIGSELMLSSDGRGRLDVVDVERLHHVHDRIRPTSRLDLN
jgi:hypothetical protein